MAVPIFWLTCAARSLAVLMASVSLLSRAFFTSASASRTSDLMSSGTFSSFSPRNFSVWYTSESAWLRTSASSRRLRSSSAYSSASLTIFSMSSLGSADPPVICTDCCLPVPRSLADTFTMPLASMSKVTSTCAARRGRDAGQLEHAELLVVGRDLTLALEDLDLHRRLVVLGGGEDLRALGRDRGVPLDQLGEDAALGLDAQRQRGHVEQQDVLDLAAEHAGLQAGADRDNLVRVDALVRLLAAGQRLDQVDHRGHPGGPADQHHVVQVIELDPGVLDHLLERNKGVNPDE